MAWARFHLPRVLAFTIGGSSGIDGLPLAAILEIPSMILGIGVAGAVAIVAVVGSLARTSKRAGWRLFSASSPEWVLAQCALAGIAVTLLIGFVRPGFMARYAMASMPSFLFGLALWARWMMAREAKWVIVVAATMFATAAGLVGAILFGRDVDSRHLFELERPSAWLTERPAGQVPKHLVVFWDGPIAEGSPEFALAEVGSFFLRRDGHQVDVTVARVAANDDPNRRVLDLTRKDGKSAILWFANDALPASRKPRIERYDPSFECRDFGGGAVTMTACRWRS